MAKSFNGPFRITGAIDVELARDGDVFVTLCAENGNVVGVILDPRALRDLSNHLRSMLFSVTDNEPTHPLGLTREI